LRRGGAGHRGSKDDTFVRSKKTFGFPCHRRESRKNKREGEERDGGSAQVRAKKDALSQTLGPEKVERWPGGKDEPLKRWFLERTFSKEEMTKEKIGGGRTGGWSRRGGREMGMKTTQSYVGGP